MRLTNAFFANHAEVVDDMLNVTGGCWTSTTVADGSTAESSAEGTAAMWVGTDDRTECGCSMLVLSLRGGDPASAALAWTCTWTTEPAANSVARSSDNEDR